GLVAPPAYGLVALVLADAAFVKERKLSSPAWIHGMGWATEPGFLGDRDLSTAPALVEAAQQAYRTSGIKDPGKSFQVAEVSDATPYQELLAYEGLGLCKREQWLQAHESGRFAAGCSLAVNLSGCAIYLHPVFFSLLV